MQEDRQEPEEGDRSWRSSKDLVARVVFGFSALVLFLFTEFWFELGEPWGPGTSALLAYLFFGLHLVLGGRRLGALDPVIWVPVAMLLFYFGLPVSIELLWPGSPKPSYDAWRLGYLPPHVERGFCALLMGLVSFLWGVHLAGLRDLSRPRRIPPDGDSLAAPALVLTLGALLMTAAGIALIGSSAIFGYYDEWWAAKKSGADARFVDVGLNFSMAGVFALLATDDPRQRLRRYFAYSIAALLAVLLVQKGDRTGLIALLVGSGWCYSQRIRRVRPLMATAAALFVLLAVPLLREFRHTKSIEETKELGARTLLAVAFMEMGGSANTMVYTLDLIPRVAGYAWGITYVDGFLQAIPNFSLTPGKSFVLYGIGREDIFGTRIAPSSWLTEQISPAWFETGGGYGFAMVAEFYYNFGLPSVLVGMTLVGSLLAWVRNRSPRSALWLVASATLFAAIATWVRNVIGYPLKIATWPVIALFVIRALFNLMARSKARPRGWRPARGIDVAAR